MPAEYDEEKHQSDPDVVLAHSIDIESNSDTIKPTEVTSTGNVEKQIDVPDTAQEEDSKYGFLIILGAFLAHITSIGVATSWGVMQDYYEQTLFKDDPKAQINLGFVGTLFFVALYAFSPVVTICISIFGPRLCLMVGSLLVALGHEMAGFSTQIWHLYLTQGIVFGIGACIIYLCVIGTAPPWFTKNRSLALGIIASGSGIGGLIFPFIMTAINSSLGPGWTFRIVGFICLASNIVTCILIKEKKPPAIRHRKKLSQILNFAIFKNTDFVLYVVAADIGMLGTFLPFFFLPSYATYHGLSIAQGSALVSVCSAMNFVCRILTGFLGDRIGKLNTFTLFTFIAALSNFFIWTFVTTYGGIMGFTVVFGLTSGSYFALISPLTLSFLGPELFPSGLTFSVFSCLVSILGINIASAIEAASSAAPYFSYKMFGGTAYALSGVVLLYIKFRRNRKFFAKL